MNYKIAFWVVTGLFLIGWFRYSFVRDQRTRLAILFHLIMTNGYLSGSELRQFVKDDGAYLLSGPHFYNLCARLEEDGWIVRKIDERDEDGIQIKTHYFRFKPERRYSATIKTV